MPCTAERSDAAASSAPMVSNHSLMRSYWLCTFFVGCDRVSASCKSQESCWPLFLLGTMISKDMPRQVTTRANKCQQVPTSANKCQKPESPYAYGQFQEKATRKLRGNKAKITQLQQSQNRPALHSQDFTLTRS